MKHNKNWRITLALSIASTALLAGCGKFETRAFQVEKPQSLIEQESLDAYNGLKTYVDQSKYPDFKLGTELSFSDLASNSVLYRLMREHFHEVSLTSNLSHVDAVRDDGSLVIGTFNDALKTQVDSAAYIHVGHLIWHERQAAKYLNSLVADIIIPGESGSAKLLDFEQNDTDASYPVVGTGSTRVSNDPTGGSGKVLRVIGPQTFPQFQVALPEGLTLADCKSVTLDFKGAGCCGLYGSGMRMAVGTSFGAVSLTNYNSPSAYGASDNVWLRSGIVLPLATLNLSNAQKQLTSFVLTVGSATGGADYLIDNVSVQWEKVGRTIRKTPEEKAEIFTGELDRWIKAIAESGKEIVKSWSVIYQPIDEVDPSKLRSGAGLAELPANTFYWQDYLGSDYARIAIGMIKSYANNRDKIFITETNLMDNPAKIQGLNKLIKYTEEKGAQIDGIIAELSLNTTDNKEKLTFMLAQLAKTDKLIKINFDVGTGTTTAQATSALYSDQAAMYKWIVSAYFHAIPANKRAGITFRSPTDRASSAAWRPNQPVGLWTNNGGYQRKPAYAGVVEALSNER